MHSFVKADWNQISQMVKFTNSNKQQPPVTQLSEHCPFLALCKVDQCNYHPLTYGKELWVFSHELNWMGHKSSSYVKETRVSTWNIENFSGNWQAVSEENRTAWCWYYCGQKSLNHGAIFALSPRASKEVGVICTLHIYFTYRCVCLFIFIFFAVGKCLYSL